MSNRNIKVVVYQKLNGRWGAMFPNRSRFGNYEDKDKLIEVLDRNGVSHTTLLPKQKNRQMDFFKKKGFVNL